MEKDNSSVQSLLQDPSNVNSNFGVGRMLSTQKLPRKVKWGLVVIVTLVLIVLSSVATVFVLNYLKGSKPQPVPVSAIPPVPSTVITPIPTVDETAGWKTYANDEYGFSFKYPKDMSDSIQDNLPPEFVRPISPSSNLILSGKDSKYKISIYINPDGYGPTFANEVWYVYYSSEKGIYVASVNTLEDIEKYQVAGLDEVMIPQDTVLNGHNIFITFTYPEEDSEVAKSLLKSILSTFKFTDNSLEPLSEYYNAGKCTITFKYPLSFKVSEYFGEDSEEQCAYITAPDYSYTWNADGRFGLYINVSRNKKGSVLNGVTLNTPDDMISAKYTPVEDTTSVAEVSHAVYKNYEGAEYDGHNQSADREFTFDGGTAIYIQFPGLKTMKVSM